RGGTIPLSYTARSPVKGDFRIGPVRARSLDPLALGAEDATLPIEARLVLAPAMEDLRRTKLQPRRTRPWYGQVASRQMGAGTDFWGVREYTAGAEVRRINWQASARLDRLLTNEYEGERSGDVVIVVDARRESFIGTETDNPIEHGVRAALGIAEHVLASKNRVGLIVQREVLDWVPPAFGRKQLYRILDHLTHVRPGGEWPFAHVAWVRLIPVALRAAPRVTLALLVGWAALDVYAIGEPRWSAALFTILSIGVAAVTLSVVLHWRGIRAVGLIAIGGGYVGAHAL